jgi:ribulose-bisphosphate carboxylase large chain
MNNSPWLRATYRIASSPGTIEARATALATEQSVEMPVAAIREANVLEDILARVETIAPAGDGHFHVVIALSAQTTGAEAGQLMSMVFGNCSLQPEIELVDIAFPAGFVSHFPGPAFGIAGLRKATGVEGRALTCTALKPQGSSVAQLAALAHTFALAGIDVVKDDHGIADQAYAPFAKRVPAVQKAIARANEETGGNTLYAPTFSGGPKQLAAQLKVAKRAGVGAALAIPMVTGIPAFTELLRAELGVPILAHPGFGGATRIAPALLFGKLFRLFGADAVIFPNHGGRFSYDRNTCLAIGDAARAPWPGVPPAMPVPAGGMTVGRVAEMLADYGSDTMLLIGGGLLSAGDKLLERSREFVEKVAE